MTLKDLFTDNRIWNKYGDMDVYNDCIDDMANAWCGTLLTKEGIKHFNSILDTYEPLLDTEIEIITGRYGFDIEAKIDQCPDYDKRWNAIRYLFECASGYCSCEDYDTWFVEAEEKEYDPLVGDPDEDAIDRIEALKSIIDNAVYWICQQEDDPKVLAVVLRKVGLTEKRISEIIG